MFSAFQNININAPVRKSTSKEAPTEKNVAPDMFAIETPEIFGYGNIEKVTNEEAITKYQIVREESFDSDLLSSFMADDYLKAIKTTPPDVDPANIENSGLVKLVLDTCVPVRHYHQILGESSKIMRFFSNTAPYNRFIHCVWDIYQTDSIIFIFYESLSSHQSIYTIVHTELASGQFPPTRIEGTGGLLSLENIYKWTYQLAQTIYNLANHAIAHRYIRPEYVFISTETRDIKLTHFEMASFAWHPNKHTMVARSRGLQDEQDHQWNHLPPECFNSFYECLNLDQWSVAVLVVFCLTGEWLFSTPLSMNSAIEQWQQWKQSEKGQLVAKSAGSLLSILDQVFLPVDQRIKANELMSLVSPSKLKLPDEPESKSPTTITPTVATVPELGTKKLQSAEKATKSSRKGDSSRGNSSLNSIPKTSSRRSNQGKKNKDDKKKKK